MASGAKVPTQVHAHDRVPLFDARVHEHSVPENPGVVHQDVETTEGLHGVTNQVSRGLPICDVGRIGDRLTAESPDLGHDLIGRRSICPLAISCGAQIIDHNSSALGRELERMRATDAATGAGDDHNALCTDLAHRPLPNS